MDGESGGQRGPCNLSVLSRPGGPPDHARAVNEEGMGHIVSARALHQCPVCLAPVVRRQGIAHAFALHREGPWLGG